MSTADHARNMYGCRCQTIQAEIIVHKSRFVPDIITGIPVSGKNFRAFSVLFERYSSEAYGVLEGFAGVEEAAKRCLSDRQQPPERQQFTDRKYHIIICLRQRTTLLSQTTQDLSTLPDHIVGSRK